MACLPPTARAAPAATSNTQLSQYRHNGGFHATQIGGAYTKNGVKRAIGQMTAVIPGQDGLYVLQLNANSIGKQDQVQALAVATGVIAQQAKITP